MPGGGHRYDWTGEAPLYWKTLFFVTVTEFVAGFLLGITLPYWAHSAFDFAHPVELRMKGGRNYFLSPWLGWYMNNYLWIFLGLLAFLVLIMIIQRDKGRRSGRK